MHSTILVQDGLFPSYPDANFSANFVAGLLTGITQNLAHLDLRGLIKLGQRSQIQEFHLPATSQETAYATWLAQEYGLAQASTWQVGMNLPLAELRRAHTPLPWPRDDTAYFCCDPVHLELTTDHVVLAQAADTQLTLAQAQALVASIQPLLDAEGLRLTLINAQEWLLSSTAPEALKLTTSSIHLALGQNIHDFLPSGPDARRWRRIMNEIQMTWHQHPLNHMRIQAGLVPINSVWLHGGLSAPFNIQLAQLTRRFSQVHTNDRIVTLLEALAQPIASNTTHDLRILQDCTDAVASQDWQAWQHSWQQIIQTWITPNLDLFAQGVLQQFNLVLSNRQQLRSISLKRALRQPFGSAWERFTGIFSDSTQLANTSLQKLLGPCQDFNA